MLLKFLTGTVVLTLSLTIATPSFAKKPGLSVEQVKQLIIEESISEYPGPCACPFNRASNGSKCGKRSAWSKPGGYSPVCYKDEVTKEMVDDWRKRNSE